MYRQLDTLVVFDVFLCFCFSFFPVRKFPCQLQWLLFHRSNVKSNAQFSWRLGQISRLTPASFCSLFQEGVQKRRLILHFATVVRPLGHLRGEMSYKDAVTAKRSKREEAIRETAALITRELSREEQRITSSSGTPHLGNPSGLF